ncbi:MAG: peptidase M15 [Synergistaceae bacterium]|jgi:uncharacterized protein YcbK (DUF882 family)|nr:peptidase M15 [Synergistaceae bacterium]MDR1515508.1 peptidase M15 [Synergistaceae bacterium]
MINDIRISPHFKLREFQCRCCGLVKLSPRLLQMLEELREEAEIPLVVTSGYRCPAHNRRVGGAPRSLHVEGCAADILAAPEAQKRLFAMAKSVGFSQVICGGFKKYLHLGYKN